MKRKIPLAVFIEAARHNLKKKELYQGGELLSCKQFNDLKKTAMLDLISTMTMRLEDKDDIEEIELWDLIETVTFYLFSNLAENIEIEYDTKIKVILHKES